MVKKLPMLVGLSIVSFVSASQLLAASGHGYTLGAESMTCSGGMTNCGIEHLQSSQHDNIGKKKIQRSGKSKCTKSERNCEFFQSS